MGNTVKRQKDWWMETADGRWMRWTDDHWEHQEAAAPPPPGWIEQWSSGTISQALGLLAVPALVLTLVLTYIPNWISPAERRVRFGATSVTQGVTFNEYIHYPVLDEFFERVNDEWTGHGSDGGIVIDFNYELRGFKGSARLPLRWTLLNARGERIRESDSADRVIDTVGDESSFRANLRGMDVGSWSIWVQTDNLPSGRYFVRLELYSSTERTQRMAYKNTRVFTVH